MNHTYVPAINPIETGRNIKSLRTERGLSVKDVQHFFHFEAPQAIYKWERGAALPTIDNLYALAYLFGVTMDDILVPLETKCNNTDNEQQDASCCSSYLDSPFQYTA